MSRRLGRPSRQQKELNKAGRNNGGESEENSNEGRLEDPQEWAHEETEDSISNAALVDTTEETPGQLESKETPLIGYTNVDQNYSGMFVMENTRFTSTEILCRSFR